MSRPGPRITDALKQIAEAIYPANCSRNNKWISYMGEGRPSPLFNSSKKGEIKF